MILKRFGEWIQLKEKLHINTQEPPLFKEGQIWWCYIGENIGTEMNGKNKSFTRPIYILKKYNKTFFLGLPLTTKTKEGSWYVSIRFKNREQRIILVQGRILDYRRMKEMMGELSKNQTIHIKEEYTKLHLSS